MNFSAESFDSPNRILVDEAMILSAVVELFPHEPVELLECLRLVSVVNPSFDGFVELSTSGWVGQGATVARQMVVANGAVGRCGVKGGSQGGSCMSGVIWLLDPITDKLLISFSVR